MQTITIQEKDISEAIKILFTDFIDDKKSDIHKQKCYMAMNKITENKANLIGAAFTMNIKILFDLSNYYDVNLSVSFILAFAADQIKGQKI